MFRALNPFQDRQSSPTPLRNQDHGDFRVDDAPPMDRPSETYGAWQATAIFDLKPFSSPPGR